MVARGLAQVTSIRGRYERYVLSPEGERRGAELTRDTLARRGQASPLPSSRPHRTAVSAETWRDQLVDFLAGVDPNATALAVDLPPTRRVAAGWRVRIERCGPTKLLIQVTPPKNADSQVPSTTGTTT
jgi:hypothetical protein